MISQTRGGGANAKEGVPTYYLANFFQKIKRKLGRKGCVGRHQNTLLSVIMVIMSDDN